MNNIYHARWLMLGLVWLLYVSFGIVVSTLPPLVGPIKEDLGLSYGQMGLVLGVWQLVYIFTAFPLGSFVDRLDIRKSLGIGILVVWVSLVVRGGAVDFWTLMIAVALFGLGGPIISSGAPKVVSMWFDESERPLASGIYATGPMVGGIIALSTAAGVVVPVMGSWRGISFVYGLIVLMIAGAWWFLAVEPVSKRCNSDKYLDEEDNTVLKDLIKLSNIQIMLLVAVVVFLVNHGVNNWLPTLLQEKGMNLAQAGAWTAGSTAFGIVGLLVIPRFASQGRRVRILSSLLLIGAASIFAMAWLSGPMVLLGLAISGVVRGPLMPVSTLVIMETRGVGEERVGAATGLFFASAEIGGFSGPALLGLLREMTGSLIPGFLILAGVSVALVPVLHFLQDDKNKSHLESTSS